MILTKIPWYTNNSCLPKSFGAMVHDTNVHQIVSNTKRVEFPVQVVSLSAVECVGF